MRPLVTILICLTLLPLATAAAPVPDHIATVTSIEAIASDTVLVMAHSISWLPDAIRPNAGLDTIAAAVHVAGRIGAYKLSWGDAPDLDSTSWRMLESLLRDAAKDTNPCVQYSCIPEPLYRLKVYDRAEPIVIEIGTRCMWWSIRRGWPGAIRLYCPWVPAPTQVRLQALVERAFGAAVQKP